MKHSFVLSKILSFISPGQLEWEHIDSLCHRVAVCLYIKHVVHFHWLWTLYRAFQGLFNTTNFFTLTIKMWQNRFYVFLEMASTVI